jgi:amino acid transporter
MAVHATGHYGSPMASASVSARTAQRPPWETIVAVAAVVSLALWPVEIHQAFGLPAHPLLIHVPVVFVPILGLAVLAVAFNTSWFDRFGLLVTAFSVVTLAATLLAVGAGEAFRKERLRDFPDLVNDPTLHDHADAGITVRLAMVILTAVLVGMLFANRGPKVARIALRVLAVLFALTAIFFVLRTGHLGAKLAWGGDELRIR